MWFNRGLFGPVRPVPPSRHAGRGGAATGDHQTPQPRICALWPFYKELLVNAQDRERAGFLLVLAFIFLSGGILCYPSFSIMIFLRNGLRQAMVNLPSQFLQNGTYP